MIVLDETISDPRLEQAIGHWYPGRVLSVRELRTHGRLLDPEIPDYLLKLRQPTFVTITQRLEQATACPPSLLHRQHQASARGIPVRTVRVAFNSQFATIPDESRADGKG